MKVVDVEEWKEGAVDFERIGDVHLVDRATGHTTCGATGGHTVVDRASVTCPDCLAIMGRPTVGVGAAHPLPPDPAWTHLANPDGIQCGQVPSAATRTSADFMRVTCLNCLRSLAIELSEALLSARTSLAKSREQVDQVVSACIARDEDIASLRRQLGEDRDAGPEGWDDCAVTQGPTLLGPRTQRPSRVVQEDPPKGAPRLDHPAVRAKPSPEVLNAAITVFALSVKEKWPPNPCTDAAIALLVDAFGGRVLQREHI